MIDLKQKDNNDLFPEFSSYDSFRGCSSMYEYSFRIRRKNWSVISIIINDRFKTKR